MSWQCAHCETVNQDVTPVCTVCDRLSPVVESYLSLEKIQRTTEYDEKLDLIHQLENDGKYEKMFEECLEAITLYQDNHLAIKKAKVALKKAQEKKEAKKLSDIIEKAIGTNLFYEAEYAIEVWEKLGFSKSTALDYKNEVAEHLARKKAVDDVVEKASQMVFNFRPNEALQEIESALLNYHSDEKLVDLRDRIKLFITKQKAFVSENQAKKKFPIPVRPKTETPETVGSPNAGSVSDLTTKKRKFPKVKRNK